MIDKEVIMKHYLHFTGLCLVLGFNASCYALEALDDRSLANQTGQDGVDIALTFPNSTISYDQILLTNTKTPGNASLVIAPKATDQSKGIELFDKSGNKFSNTTPSMRLKIDADGNNGKPVLNTNVVLPTNLGQIRINPFSIYLNSGDKSIYSGSGASRSLVPTATQLIELTQDTQINLTAVPQLNIQLGNTPQGHMVKLTNGAIGSIRTNGINVYSKNSGSTTGALNFDLDLTAANQATGFRLYDTKDSTTAFTGFYADITDNGLVIGADGTTDKLNATLSNVMIGTAGAADSATFNGLKNGSIGNFGMIGASVTQLKVNVKGM